MLPNKSSTSLHISKYSAVVLFSLSVWHLDVSPNDLGFKVSGIRSSMNAFYRDTREA